MTDWIVLGAGLSGSLLVERLVGMGSRVVWIDQKEALGSSHTWSFHDGDLSEDSWKWVRPLVSKRWEEQEVRFPMLKRILSTPYCSIQSEALARHMRERIQDARVDLRLSTQVTEVSKNSVRLESGERISGERVVDARGFVPDAAVDLGYQKFTGVDLKLAHPHGLTRPLIMEVDVEQVEQDDGFRFIYTLPWDAHRLLLEDTRYSDTGDLDRERDIERLLRLAEQKGFEVESIERVEQGALPIPIRGRPAVLDERWDVVKLGMRGWFFHATTGYSFPNAVRGVEKLLEVSSRVRTGAECGEAMRAYACESWDANAAYRFLNRLLFLAAKPEQRFLTLQKFYGHSEALIDRFYAGKSTKMDWLKIYSGKPPVRVARAMKVILSEIGA